MDMETTGVWTAHARYLSTIIIILLKTTSDLVCVWERWGWRAEEGETIAVLVRESSGTLLIIRLLGSAVKSPGLENQG